MKTSILTLLLCGASLALFQSNPVLGACNPKCKQGQTCRFEQPNTYYCQNINGVQGSQQSSMGAANSNAMQPSRGFNPRGNGVNGAKQVSGGAKASDGCSGNASACVSVRIGGYETLYKSVEEAQLSILQQSLMAGRPVSAELVPNDQAVSEFMNGHANLASLWDRVMSYPFVDRPDDRMLQDVSSMIPPISDRMRNMGIDQQIAQLNAQFGMDALMGMMNELKDIAIGSGASGFPALAWAGYALIVAAAPVVYEAGKDIYNAYNPDPTSPQGDLDGDGRPNYEDDDDDGDGIKDWDELPGQEQSDCRKIGNCDEQKAEIARRKGDKDDDGIIAETEGRMFMAQTYEMLQSYQQMFMGMQNPFYFR